MAYTEEQIWMKRISQSIHRLFWRSMHSGDPRAAQSFWAAKAHMNELMKGMYDG